MRRSLVNTATAIALVTGAMAACDAVPETHAARTLEAAPAVPAPST